MSKYSWTEWQTVQTKIKCIPCGISIFYSIWSESTVFRPVCPKNIGYKFNSVQDQSIALDKFIIIIIIRFFAGTGATSTSVHPFQVAGLLHYGRSHTRSPGISIMRVDSRELPLSAIPLCQLLPCHLGPPRPTLSINLYDKCCLDCTIGAFHMSQQSLLSFRMRFRSSMSK